MPSKSIICPNCSTSVDLSKALYEEVKDAISADLESQVEEATKELSDEVASLTNGLAQAHLREGSSEVQLKTLEAKLKAVESNKEIEFELRLANERDGINQQLKVQMEGYKKSIDETAELATKEHDDQIRQLREQLDLAKKKADQGSMQTQGEAQELVIEEFLAITFPLDTISEIKKGAMGADTLQTVNTRDNLSVGTIYYESKRTKTFNMGWIDKFKQDMIAKGADVGIMVSAARPTGEERASNIRGVWVCSVEEFKILSQAIRSGIIEVHSMKSIQENKSDKMELLYNYLTGSEFRLQVESIVEGFSQMQEDLDSEKRAMLSIWNKREKQI